MKKYGLLKALGIVFLIFVVLSWLIPIGSYASGTFALDVTAPMGLFDLIRVPLLTVSNYAIYGIIVLLIGGLYGVMNQSGVYTKLLNAMTKKFKGHEKRFLILSIVLFAILSSISGLNFAILVIVPLFISAILLLGYDKMTALMSTIGAMIVGTIGSTYGFNVCGYINYYFGIDVNNGIFVKLAMLALTTIVFILYVTSAKRLKKIEIKEKAKAEKKAAKAEKVEKKSTKKEAAKKTAKNTKAAKEKKVVATKAEATKEDKIAIPLYNEKEEKKKSIWPLAIVLTLTFIFLLVAMFNWRYGFEVTLFEEVYESIMAVEIKGYAILQNILGSLSPLGYWTITELGIVLIILTLLIGWLYNVKFKDGLDAFIEGAKEVLPVAIYVTLANIIMAVVVNIQTSGNLFLTISDFLLNMTTEFNFLTTSLVAAIGSLFYNDFPYLLNSLVSTLGTRFTDASIYPVIGLIFQSFYGLVMMIVPTSLMLIAGLSYLKISYKEYLKYAWKLFLQLFVVIVAVIIVMFLCI